MSRCLLIAFFLAGTAAALHADYKQSFRNGIDAFDKKKWGATAQAMRSAIAENPNESGQKVLIYGTRYVEYMPHFFLGLALARLNKCDEAIEPLRTSEQQGVVKRTSQYGELQTLLKTCALSVPSPDPAPPDEDPPPSLPAPVPPVVHHPVTPVPEPVPLPRPLPLSLPPGPDPQLSEARQSLTVRVEEARRVLASTPATSRTNKARTELEGGLKRAAVEGTASSVATVRAAAASLGAAVQEFRRIAGSAGAPIDPRLADAVRAYIRGEYQQVTAILDRAGFPDNVTRGEAVLFRAAARHALFLIGGEKDSVMRNQVVADLREYRRLQSAKPDSRLFPPPFRSLYDQITR